MADPEPIRSQVRIPLDLHAKLPGTAKAEGSSFNPEIVRRLEDSFGGPPVEQVVVALRRIERKL